LNELLHRHDPWVRGLAGAQHPIRAGPPEPDGMPRRHVVRVEQRLVLGPPTEDGIDRCSAGSPRSTGLCCPASHRPAGGGSGLVVVPRDTGHRPGLSRGRLPGRAQVRPITHGGDHRPCAYLPARARRAAARRLSHHRAVHDGSNRNRPRPSEIPPAADARAQTAALSTSNLRWTRLHPKPSPRSLRIRNRCRSKTPASGGFRRTRAHHLHTAPHHS
jgi:hypothetical protein